MKRLAGLLLAGFLLLSGCDSDSMSDPDEARVSLSLVTTGLVSASKGGDHITITSARILIRAIQFHARDGDTIGDSLDFRTEPLVMQLSLDATANEVAVATIPNGSYHKISFRIHKPEDDETPPDPDFKIGSSGNERFSVIVEGEFEGATFTYRSTKSMHQRLFLPEDLVIDGTETGPLNVTLIIDMSNWFFSKDGELLDPTSESGGNRSRIDKSIRESFRIFKDRDRNGRPD